MSSLTSTSGVAAPARQGAQRAARTTASARTIPLRNVQQPGTSAKYRSRKSVTVKAAIAEPARGGLSDVALQTEFRRKRLQTQSAQIAPDVTTIRSLDWQAKPTPPAPRESYDWHWMESSLDNCYPSNPS